MTCPVAYGYLGGPVRAHIQGLDETTQRVYYYLEYHDESTACPEVWFFDLNGANPARPKRAYELEDPSDLKRGIWCDKQEIKNQAWRSLVSTLKPLEAMMPSELRIGFFLDSLGIEQEWGSDRFAGYLEIEVGSFTTACTLEAFCEAMRGLKGLYKIPSRKGLLMVARYIGRSYGCEEVEKPILLLEEDPDTKEKQQKLSSLGENLRLEPRVFRRTSRGCCAGHFAAYSSESEPSGDSTTCFIEWYRLMETQPQVWMGRLDAKHSAYLTDLHQIAIDFLPSVAGETIKELKPTASRKLWIPSMGPVDLNLHIEKESIPIDSLCGVARYRYKIEARTPAGGGVATITAFDIKL